MRGRGEAAPPECFVHGGHAPREGFLPRGQGVTSQLPRRRLRPAGPPAATAPAGHTAPTPGSRLHRPISGASASMETPRSYRRANPSDLSPPPAARLRSDVVAAPRARTHRRPRPRTRGHGAFRPREAAWALGRRLWTRVADPRRGRHRCRHREAESGRSRGTPALRSPHGLQVTLTACRDVRDTAQPPWRPCGARSSASRARPPRRTRPHTDRGSL